MIRLLNGHAFEYMVASGGLAFDGRGWPWERPLVRLGLIKPELFTIVVKTLTRHPRAGNLRWWKPWDSVRLIDGGAVNKVGLTNPGIEWWCNEVAPKVNWKKVRLVGSIFGDEDELVEMAKMFNDHPIVGLEVNASCPNTGHPIDVAEAVIRCATRAATVSHHPIIVKVSVDQDYLAIARGLYGYAEAISLNAVPWETAFPDEVSPLWRLEKRVGGGGGVSGIPAQRYNWSAVRELAEQGVLPVIGPGVMQFEDIARLKMMGASAVSFGAIHLRTPWRPTSFVRRQANCR